MTQIAEEGAESRLQDFKQTPLGFGVIAVAKAKTLGRGVVEHGFADDHLEMLLLLLPVPNIPAIDAHRDRTVQTG